MVRRSIGLRRVNRATEVRRIRLGNGDGFGVPLGQNLSAARGGDRAVEALQRPPLRPGVVGALAIVTWLPG